MKLRIHLISSDARALILQSLAVIALSVCASAGIIPSERMAPWRGNVGVPGGIPKRTRVFQNIVTDRGADPTGQTDCTAILQDAIANCPAGQIVYVPEGTFLLSNRVYLAWKQNFTLRGAGQGKTIIKSSGSGGYFLFGSQQYPAPNTYLPITSGATQGSNTITLANTDAFVVDQPMSIAPAMPTWAHNLGGISATSRTMRVTFKVRSKTATTVTFDPPCPFDFSQMSPAARPFLGPNAGYNFIQGIGIEDLTMDMSGCTTAWAIEFGQAWGCWVKGVEVKGAYSRQMRFGTLVRSEIRGCYTHDVQGSGPNHEGIDFDGDCCWNLVIDNVCDNGGGSPIQFGDSMGANACNVVAYNYVLHTTNGFWDISFNHSPHNMLNLAEGNVIDNYKDDGYFGSASHNTLFRNRIKSFVELKHYSNYYNIVGNVLGTAGVSTDYETEQPDYFNPPGNIRPIYALGFPNIGNDSYSGTLSSTAPPDYTALSNQLANSDNQKLDQNVKATLLRHGNYDYVHNSTVWDPGIDDRTIPDSLFLPGKPTDWPSGIPWPPIGPDRLDGSIPAQVRYTATPPASPSGVRRTSP